MKNIKDDVQNLLVEIRLSFQDRLIKFYNADAKWKYLYRKSKLSDNTLGNNETVKKSKTNYILTDDERDYLSNLIKPFISRVVTIYKKFIIINGNWYEQIEILYESVLIDNYYTFNLPEFEKGTMFKGMESGKQYSLEDLEL